MPIAIVIGADPLYYLTSQIPAPEGISEFEYWGSFADEPLEMVCCETCPDILIPAQAEIVIEGTIDPEVRVLEGPFSEFTGYYSNFFYLPVIQVKAITMRHDPIYQYMYMGREPTEGHRIDHLMYSASMFSQIQAMVPEVSDIAILGTEGFTTAISIKKGQNRPGLVRQLGMAVRGSRAGRLIKNLIVMDDDLDVRNIHDIIWALSVRFQGAVDFTTINDMPGCFLDPSEPSLGKGPGVTSFTILDLTMPLPPHDESYKRGIASAKKTDRAREILKEIGLEM